jgi:serine/threonine protein kinase
MKRAPLGRNRTATNDRLSTGTRIGDYKIDRQLRSEEIGIVYAATHKVLPRRVAIKVIHPSEQWLKQLAVQLLREACVLEALHHDGVPRVYECGVLPDKRPWFALELIDGPTIDELIDEAPLAVSDLVVAIRAIADVLEHAHARGVVHHRLSEACVVKTPERKSPFSVRGWGDVVVQDSELAADPRADIRALGMLSYRALTGELVTEHASAREECPSAPLELTKLIDEMLSSDPDARPIASLVLDRANWLAETLELLPPPRPRWRPKGDPKNDPAKPSPVIDAPSRGFKIRIRG